MTCFRSAAVGLCFLVCFSVAGCSGDGKDRTQSLLDGIAHAPDSELPKFIYGYDKSTPGAQQVLLGLMKVSLRAPSPEQQIRVEATKGSGRFKMIIVRVPWPHAQKGDLLPVLVTGETGKEQVVGYLLPFDDLIPLMQGTDMQDIQGLSMWWISEYASQGR